MYNNDYEIPDNEILDKDLIEELTTNVTNITMKGNKSNESLIGRARFSLNGNVYITINIEGKKVKATCQVPKIFCQWIKETYDDENDDESEISYSDDSSNDENKNH